MSPFSKATLDTSKLYVSSSFANKIPDEGDMTPEKPEEPLALSKQSEWMRLGAPIGSRVPGTSWWDAQMPGCGRQKSPEHHHILVDCQHPSSASCAHRGLQWTYLGQAPIRVQETKGHQLLLSQIHSLAEGLTRHRNTDT